MRKPIELTVYGTCIPQGSSKGFVYKKGGKYHAAVTTDNRKLKPWRQEITQTALQVTAGPHLPEDLPFPKHVPVQLSVHFFVARPPSIPAKRVWPAVKPDLSKLVRCIEDSLTGVVYLDDSQIVKYQNVQKSYGVPERCEITVQEYPTSADLFGRGIADAPQSA